MGVRDWVLGIGIGNRIGIGESEWGFRIGIGNWDWDTGLGFGIEIWD